MAFGIFCSITPFCASAEILMSLHAARAEYWIFPPGSICLGYVDE